jgi:UDP-N-acetylmuramate--alanine ligase
MVAQILIHAGLDPTVVVGGKVEAIGSNAKMGSGSHVVAEADESDGSFLLLPATYAIVTNIDFDHMEYYQTQERLDLAFIQFVKNLPFYGCAWMCGDDAGVRRIQPFLSKPVQTYGIEQPSLDLMAKNIKIADDKQQAEVIYRGKTLGRLQLGVLGRHNLLNALSAIGISISLGIEFAVAAEALSHFRHVRRRFDQRYLDESTGIRIIDDYGHHPTEIRAVLQTALESKPKRIVTVFQPHRFTRTQLCWNEFLSCFEGTDELVLLPIYPAGEPAIPGVTSEALAREIQESKSIKISTVGSLDEAAHLVQKLIQPGDWVLTLGAGSVTRLAGMLADHLEKKRSNGN